MKHLLKNETTGRLSYRRIYPPELRPFIPGNPREFKKSLKTSRIEEPAGILAYHAAQVEYEATVTAARKQLEGRFDTLDPPMIAYLAETFKVEWLEENAATRASGNTYGLKLERRGIDEQLDWFRTWRSAGELGEIVDRWQGDAQRLLDVNRLFLDPSGPDRLDDLCWAINGAAIEACTECLARLGDRGHETPAAPERPSKGLSVPVDVTKATRPSNSGSSFDSLARAYMENPTAKVPVNTKDNIQTALRYFKEVHQKPVPEEITRRMVTEWLELMAQRPTPLKGPERSLTLPELATRYSGKDDVRRMASQTLVKYKGALATCWRQMVNRGDMPDLPNPFENHKISSTGHSTATKGLNLPEMQAIFDLPIFTAGERPKQGRGEASYWIPLLLLWTGARPEEVAQLLVTDIFEDNETGKWMLRFSDKGVHPVKGPQVLKTSRYDSGGRTFPVPQSLLDLGLDDYMNYLSKQGEVALFPGLTLKRPKRGELFPSYGSWWSGYINKAGILPKGRRPSRELRHNWTTAARVSGMDEGALEYIQGHSPAGKSMNARYGHRDVYGEQIEKLVFKGLDLSRVRPWSPPESSSG